MLNIALAFGTPFALNADGGNVSNLSKTTYDHDEIRKWAEERGGKPSHVKGTGGSDDAGILRIDFPGYSGEGKLEPISWDEFFEKFDAQELALIYQEKTADGQRSNFNKIVSRHTVEEREEAAAHGSAGSHRKAAGGKK
jgi:anaerobic selenocysteine-containing dehydrogenase